MQSTSVTRPLCLFGDVVQEDGSVLRRQYVLIVDGRIRSVSSEKPPRLRAPDYTLAEDELIFPAFLDLHTHSSYNMLPLWHSPYWAWDNRFQWRANPLYKQAIGGVNRGIAAAYGHGSRIYEAFNAFSELMAIAGGTTVLQENAHLDGAGFPTRSHILIRSTGDPGDMGLSGMEEIVSVTDFYEPDPYTAPRTPYQDTSTWRVKPVAKGSYSGASYIADFTLSVSGTRTRGTIVHLAEGRSGYLQRTLGPDAYTRAEFEAFKAFLSASYADGDIDRVRAARLLLIHGCGMNTISNAGLARSTSGRGKPGSTMAETVRFLKDYGIGVIWSPVSNLLLYQDTTNVLPLLDAGVPVILGTDWTPSGSKTAWEEAKFAADFLEARGWSGDIDRTCFQSITSVAADALGLPLGRVRAGNFADVVIMRRPAGARRGNALATFRTAGDAEVRAVLVGGQALYGDADVLRALGTTPCALPGEVASLQRGERPIAAAKAFALPADCSITVEQLAQAVQTADHVVGKRRPKFLAADDVDYQNRMHELRDWVRNFGRSIQPTPRPAPPPPTGLAPGEFEWMYNPSLDPKNRIDSDVAGLLARIAPCRDVRCEVPKRHPFYHAEVLTQAGDSYGHRVPCRPVLPVLTNKHQLFVMGDYPTAKFTARSTNCLPVITGNPDEITSANHQLYELLNSAAQQPHGNHHLLQTYIEEIGDLIRGAYARPDLDRSSEQHRSYGSADYTPPRSNQFFVPVGDVFAPMQDASYFDGYKVRNVAAGVFFQQAYLTPVGIDINSQVWLTNMIKCFLFHDSMAASYQALGWTDVKVEQSYSELLPVGKVCSQWLNEEVRVCDPKLVLTVGKPPCTVLHNIPFADSALQGRVYNELLGVRLPAHDARLENAIATKLQLKSRYPAPFTNGSTASTTTRSASGSRTAAADTAPPHPVSIQRVGPWADYNVFHMMHPQAVMMSQTAVSTTLLSAIRAVLGARANGLSLDQLQEALAKYLQRRSVVELIRALPYGQRDDFVTNGALLERHAVTMANLADTLVALKLVSGRRINGDRVLAAQAAELAHTYHLADSAEAELRRLKQQRTAQQDRIAGYLHARRVPAR